MDSEDVDDGGRKLSFDNLKSSICKWRNKFRNRGQGIAFFFLFLFSRSFCDPSLDNEAALITKICAANMTPKMELICSRMLSFTRT